MKSLILKDLYIIGHNAKSLLFMLAVFAAAFIPTSGVDGFIFACAILCSMMIITTFSVDDNSKWTRYAMIMPVSRKDVVVGKFIILAIFCVIGSLLGLVIGLIGGFVVKKASFDLEVIGKLLFLSLAACSTALILGSISIPLIFKFGAEKGRILLLVSFLFPSAVCIGIYKLLVFIGVEFTDKLVFTILCCIPIIAFIWCYVMYLISYKFFEHQEL